MLTCFVSFHLYTSIQKHKKKAHKLFKQNNLLYNSITNKRAYSFHNTNATFKYVVVRYEVLDRLKFLLFVWRKFAEEKKYFVKG